MLSDKATGTYRTASKKKRFWLVYSFQHLFASTNANSSATGPDYPSLVIWKLSVTSRPAAETQRFPLIFTEAPCGAAAGNSSLHGLLLYVVSIGLHNGRLQVWSWDQFNFLDTNTNTASCTTHTEDSELHNSASDNGSVRQWARFVTFKMFYLLKKMWI